MPKQKSVEIWGLLKQKKLRKNTNRKFNILKGNSEPINNQVR